MLKITKQSMRLIYEALTVYIHDIDNNKRAIMGYNRANRRIKQAQLLKKILLGELTK